MRFLPPPKNNGGERPFVCADGGEKCNKVPLIHPAALLFTHLSLKTCVRPDFWICAVHCTKAFNHFWSASIAALPLGEATVAKLLISRAHPLITTLLCSATSGQHLLQISLKVSVQYLVSSTRRQGRAECAVWVRPREYVASEEPPVVCPCCPPGGVWLQSARQRQGIDQWNSTVPALDATWLKVG